MINKERYLPIYYPILCGEYCKEIKLNNSVSEEQRQYIKGYMAAARVLNVLDYEELKEIVNKVHFNAFGKTIEERKQAGIKQVFFK